VRTYVLVAVAIFAVLLQVSFLPAVHPFGVVPNLVMVIIAAVALSGPLVSTMVIALGSGFLLDLISGSDFGLRMGILAVTVLLCALLRRSGLQLGFRAQLIIVILAITTISALVAIMEIIFSGGRVNLGSLIFSWLGILILNFFLGLIVGPASAILAARDERYGA